MYLTNQQAWDEVTKSFRENERRTKICIELFGQENLIGLSDEQRELYFNSIQNITMQFILNLPNGKQIDMSRYILMQMNGDITREDVKDKINFLKSTNKL